MSELKSIIESVHYDKYLGMSAMAVIEINGPLVTMSDTGTH